MIVYLFSSFVLHDCYLGQPVLYDFLDFQNNLGLALFVVMGCSVILPLIHIGLCYMADKVTEVKTIVNVEIN